MNGSNPLILAVEDDENDRVMLRLAVERAKVNNPMVVVSDGREAADFLTGSAPYWDRTSHLLPSLLLLALDMPRMDGFDFSLSRKLKSLSRLRSAPCKLQCAPAANCKL